MTCRRACRCLVNLSVILMGCAAIGACAAHERETAEIGGDHIHYRSTVTDMSDIMQAKLIHTQAIVEGLALGDMGQVAANAEVLHEFSLRSSWMVHDTVTYIARSDHFRETVLKLWQSAEEGNTDAAMTDYLAMTRSCLDCHTYLRAERRFLDAPGRQSRILDALPLPTPG